MTSRVALEREDQRHVDRLAVRDHVLDRREPGPAWPGSSRTGWACRSRVELLRLVVRRLGVVRERRVDLDRDVAVAGRAPSSQTSRHQVAGVRDVRRASSKKMSTTSSSAPSRSRSLLVVGVPSAMRLLEDRRVGGDAGDGVVLHQLGELADSSISRESESIQTLWPRPESLCRLDSRACCLAPFQSRSSARARPRCARRCSRASRGRWRPAPRRRSGRVASSRRGRRPSAPSPAPRRPRPADGPSRRAAAPRRDSRLGLLLEELPARHRDDAHARAVLGGDLAARLERERHLGAGRDQDQVGVARTPRARMRPAPRPTPARGRSGRASAPSGA